MTKLCGLCNQNVKSGDKVIALLLATFQDKGESYDLQIGAQTILSHVVCPTPMKKETDCVHTQGA